MLGHWTFALAPIAIGFRSALDTRPYTMPFSSTTLRVPAPGSQEALVPDAERPNFISARAKLDTLEDVRRFHDRANAGRQLAHRWTLSAARMSSFSAYREAAGVTGRPFCPRRIVPILSIPEAGDW